MSDHGFHVHGPHDHELEHAAQHDPEGMAGQLAVITAILATVGALFSYQGGATQANAGLLKNEAAIKKTEAANQWNYFQSKSTKQSLAEFARDMSPDDRRQAWQDKVSRYAIQNEPDIFTVEEGSCDSSDLVQSLRRAGLKRFSVLEQ